MAPKHDSVRSAGVHDELTRVCADLEALLTKLL